MTRVLLYYGAMGLGVALVVWSVVMSVVQFYVILRGL